MIRLIEIRTQRTVLKKRLIELDAIKGIAIVLMVYGHVTYIGSLKEEQGEIKNFIYSFHMPLFLLISGYLFIFQTDIEDRILRTIRGIGIPYLLFVTVYLFGLLLAQQLQIHINKIPPDSLVQMLYTIFLHPLGPYWFLHSLFIMQIVLLMVSLALHQTQYTNTTIMLSFSLIILLLLGYLDVVPIWASIYFLTGVLIAVLFKKDYQIKLSPVLILFIPFAFAGVHFYDQILHFSLIQWTWVFLLFSFFVALLKKYDMTFPVFLISWIGRNTLIILLVHALFIFLFKLGNNLLLSVDKTGIVHSIVSTVLIVMASILVSKIFDNLKLSKYTFGKPILYSRFKPLDN